VSTIPEPAGLFGSNATEVLLATKKARQSNTSADRSIGAPVAIVLREGNFSNVIDTSGAGKIIAREPHDGRSNDGRPM
jgi:hypothetical protein